MGNIDFTFQSWSHNHEENETGEADNMAMIRVLILGHNGMLGHMVAKYLKDKCDCNTVVHRFPSDDFKREVSNFDGEYIINCIGAIPQRTKKFNINFELPIWLHNNTNCKIIHPSTDCEIDYDEYGTSKRLASIFIKQNPANTKIIKTSIIGPELLGSHSLFSWFLSNKGEVKGYKNAYWNGITTLEWAKICYGMITHWDDFDIENIVQSNCISKYELLCIIKEVYQKDINIIPYENVFVDKCLNGNIITKNIKEQITELKAYYENH